ncbi:MAG: LysR family transcriptional regulator [Clostridia bacterium]|nr:LysR family transcriptional regulator [Clostridia bacterium]
MEINYESYRIFYTVAIHGSISKAAEALYISQPAITKAIKKLENELEITLFNRSPKGVTLTENGKVFFEFVKNGIESFVNGEHKLTSLKNLETGTIKIGASTTVTKYFLLPFIEEFHKRYPKIDISITNHLTTTLVSMLKKGSLDFLIVNLPMKTDNDLEITRCMELHDCFAGNKKYKEEINKKISLKKLVEEYPIITQKEPSNTRNFLNNLMDKYDVDFHPKIDVVSYSLVKDFAKIGMGVSYITKEFAKEELENNYLFEIPIKEKIPERGLGIVLSKNMITSFATQRFIDIILDEKKK